MIIEIRFPFVAHGASADAIYTFELIQIAIKTIVAAVHFWRVH